MGELKDSTYDGSNSGESCKISSEVLTAGDRKLVKVELLQEETTHVSWKKLMDEASKENGLFGSAPELPLNVNPKIEFRFVRRTTTENEMADQPHSNRFNAVIQKIERLYMSKDSSDGEELDGAPDDDKYDTEDSFIDDVELDDYFEVDNSPIKHDGFFVNKGKLERLEPSTTSNQQPKKMRRKESANPCGDAIDVCRKQAKMAKTAGIKDQSAAPGPSSKNISNDSKTVQDSIPHLKAQNGNDSLALENVKHTDKVNHKPRNATSPKLKAAGSFGSLHLQEPSASTENQDANISSQAGKRRLPRDVKLKLAKVARIAASQGNVSGELINRLMSIVGHLIQIRSLKRNLKIMIDAGNFAIREKDTRFQRIKNEVIEILKTQVPLMESQAANQEAGTSDDFLDVGSVGNPPLKKFVMDAALEEKLCDLYDIFVEGLDEYSSPQIRKLYTTQAELWPNRLMDNHEIKRAICREKERRRALKGNLGKEIETTDSSCDRSKQQHEKPKGTSNLINPAAEGKTVRRKTVTGLEKSHLPAEKQLVLGFKQQTHSHAKSQAQTQTQTQAPPDLNLPS